MPGPAAILKELHRLRRHLTELDERIAGAPRRVTVAQKKLAHQEEVFTQAKEHLKRLALDIREKEGNVKATQGQIKKYEKQLDSAANKKEYDTLKSEIAQEQAHISKIEDEILAAMTETEEKNALLPEAEKVAQKARADYAQFEKEHQENLDRCASEKTRAQEELKTVEASLPGDVKPQYDRLLAAKGPDAMSGVNGRTCMACYTEITAQMMSELKREMFLICKNCGRMLYTEG